MKKITLVLILLLTLTACSVNSSKTETTPTDYIYEEFSTDQGIIDASLVDVGDVSRIISAMQRAENGEPITIGFFGGSITWGASSKTKSESYAQLVSTWWRNKFPASQIKVVNAGLSGTGSILGVHRVNDDLLDRDPDFVILEFAVNDSEDIQFNQAYETLTRSILNGTKNPGLLMLFMTLDSGYNTQEDKTLTGLHYNVPMISYRDGLIPSIKNGSLTWDETAADFIHPNSIGHKIAAEMIIYQLEQWYTQIDINQEITTELPEPRTGYHFTNASFFTSKDLEPITYGGFKINDHAYWNLPNGWQADTSNDPLIFEVTGKAIGLVYNQTNDGKGANIAVSIDGNEPLIITSSSPYSYDYLNTHIIFTGDAVASHQVSLTYLDNPPEGCSGEDFALLGIVTSD